MKQLSKLNGASPAHARCDLLKKFNCYKKKWSASSVSLDGGSLGGEQMVHLSRAKKQYRICTVCILKAYMLMLSDRRDCALHSTLVFSIYGIMYLVTLS